MIYRTKKYNIGTPLIKYLRFDDLIAFGMIVDRTFNFYIIEWYIADGQIKTESCLERSVKNYRENYKDYIKDYKKLKKQGKLSG